MKSILSAVVLSSMLLTACGEQPMTAVVTWIQVMDGAEGAEFEWKRSVDDGHNVVHLSEQHAGETDIILVEGFTNGQQEYNFEFVPFGDYDVEIAVMHDSGDIDDSEWPVPLNSFFTSRSSVNFSMSTTTYVFVRLYRKG